MASGPVCQPLFILNAPGAKDVFVTGVFDSWSQSIRMERDGTSNIFRVRPTIPLSDFGISHPAAVPSTLKVVYKVSKDYSGLTIQIGEKLTQLF